MATAAFLSFRYSETDGVSVVTRTWIDVFRDLGFATFTVAGEPPADRVVEGLGIRSPVVPERGAVADALADADLVVVENLATIPLNVAAARVVGDVLAGRPTILHHHDPPWERAEWSWVSELPLDGPGWRHVCLSDSAAAAFAERGMAATVIRNAFPEPGPADRDAVRATLGVAPDRLLVAHPVRAIARKEVPTAVALAEALGATYWLLGPAEDGYGPTLEQVLGDARCPVLHRSWASTDEIYAAADLVAYPSSWEGFGNPPIEAALRHRPAAVGRYPVATELRAMGFRFLDPTDVDGARRAVAASPPDDVVEALHTNAALARTHFSLASLRDALAHLLDEAGWSP